MTVMRITQAGGMLAVAALLAAGCSTASSTTTRPTARTTPHARPVPANPVPVLKMTGATPDKGEKHGTAGVENDQVAHGRFPGGEQVWVYTYDTPAHRSYWIAHPATGPQDGESRILGPSDSLIIVDAVSLTRAGGPTAKQIAARTGGAVLKTG